MRDRAKTQEVKKRNFETPRKRGRISEDAPEPSYGKIWAIFFIVMAVSVLLGIFSKHFYVITTGNWPNRREVNTFTQFRTINRYMLIWPVIYMAFTYYSSPTNLSDHESVRIFKGYLRSHVFGNVLFIYLFYYTIYYTTELMKSAYGQEVISGHIYTGILASSSFLNTLIFMHCYKESNQLYKVGEVV